MYLFYQQSLTISKRLAVNEATEKDTDRAVASAKAAFPSWSALSPDQRAVYFKKLASLIRESNDELAALEAASMGKPLGAFFDAQACAAKWDHFAEVGYMVQGTTSVQTPGYINMTLRQPYGVVAAIIPWNVPLLFLANKLAPALIVGNTVVLKSSEKAPLTVSAKAKGGFHCSYKSSLRKLRLWYRKRAFHLVFSISSPVSETSLAQF